MYDEQNRDGNGGWRWDKTISVTHVLTTISAIVSVIIFISTINTRLSVLESTLNASLLAQQLVNAKTEAQMAEIRKLTRDDYQTISNKLDRIMERERPSR